MHTVGQSGKLNPYNCKSYSCGNKCHLVYLYQDS